VVDKEDKQAPDLEDDGQLVFALPDIQDDEVALACPSSVRSRQGTGCKKQTSILTIPVWDSNQDEENKTA